MNFEVSDISKGLESRSIPSTSVPTPPFQYLRTTVISQDFDLSDDLLVGCDCENECETATCTNRLIQHGITKKLYIARHDTKGLCLHTFDDVQRGEFICEYAGQVILQSVAAERYEQYRAEGRSNYILCVLEHGRDSMAATRVDPTIMGNVGRFANHSCEPNTHVVPVRVGLMIPRLCLFALRDIKPLEELTFSYGAVFEENAQDLIPCLCGAAACKKCHMYIRPMSTSPMYPDPSSLSNSGQIKSTHLHLKLSADFNSKILHGSVTHDVEATSDVSVVSLDTSFLDIKSVTSHHHEKLEYELQPRNEVFGSRLDIKLPKSLSAGAKSSFTIHYQTTDKCTAAQWLEPSMTVGKKHPYMFTQCQAIHARSLVPCFDTPGVKLTYTAEITAPAQFRALMSAIPESDAVEDSATSTKTWKFKQPISIPSYLIALAIGNIVGKPVGPRSTVWCEPEMVDAAQWEFPDTETFVETGEKLLTPYVWGRYDLLVLPSSFPYGGMENPCLTFVTPTLLAGDRSLQDVVAHEISHSWMGNLVTTKDWQNFWLNEGFTMWCERKIIGRMHGNAEADFSAIIGMKALQESIDLYEEIHKPELSALLPNLTGGVDPDDAFSSVPYEKGFNFLFYLESLLGKDSMEEYMRAHVKKFSHKSIDTNDFKTFLYEFLADKKTILDSVDWNAWLNGTGMPPVKNHFDESLAVACDALVKKVEAARTDSSVKFEKSEFDAFSPSQKMVFLEKLLTKPPYSHAILATLDAAFQMMNYQSAEIKFRWCWLCLQASYKPIYTVTATFLGQVGRMKYVRPLYRALSKAEDGGKELAIKTFEANRTFYHPICRDMVAKDLGLAAIALKL
ncbi:leukotriene-A4 hydrolase [Synchytrium microbalum]|uniref:Leukotriene-A4 hydrolase n=1 Tax=Synchytrium microbalum TaxID=1806994 RepID=A0A507C391_9FUNG|nr:leukotriene-A4 hydrolase [Synchytrium microbalum]TPX33921.1 leukotriene-A4 hydrolase [Synchytrium microbalum]